MKKEKNKDFSLVQLTRESWLFKSLIKYVILLIDNHKIFVMLVQRV